MDGVKSLTPKERLSLVDKISLSSKAAPVRRVWIPKPGKKEKRPLGIPTINDRALQGLTKMALEPEWEARFEPNSYGFRPGRSCHDAIEAIFNAIRVKPKYVLDADISQCFDKINQEKLLKKLNTFPTLRRQIRAWLKAGVMDNNKLFPTSEGTPQGGIISPLLANIALHGMEECVKKYAETLEIRDSSGRVWSKSSRRRTLSLIRYADDFVILHKDYTVVQRCREIISEWLKDMGLELKPSKTRLTHTLHNVGKEKVGFDFLGFNICQYKVGKYACGQNNRELLGFKTIIKPTKDSIIRHYNEVARIIDTNKSSSQEVLIFRLNPVIRGWCNYYSTTISKKVFCRLDKLVWWKLWKWAVKRHPNKGKKWIKSKYFQRESHFDKKTQKWVSKDWIFATTVNGNINKRLLAYADTKIIRHTKVKGDASPYDGNLIYWSTRLGRNPMLPKRTVTLLKTQKGKCTWCGLTFREDDVVEADHIIPKSKGGKDTYKNIQLLHLHCHDEKTRTDGSLDPRFKPEKTSS